MKKYFYFLLLIFIIIVSCHTKNSNRVYFTINPENRQIVIPVHFNDSIVANMVFDTGPHISTFVLDSSFFTDHLSCFALAKKFDSIQTGSAWTDVRFPSSIYETSQKVKIGNFDFIYNYIKVYDWKRYFSSDNSEGLFNISEQDTINIWELNFEHNYLEIHDSNNFQIPENCILLKLEKNEDLHYPFNVNLSMICKFINGDTLSIDHLFVVDSGMPEDIALVYPASELDFFNKRDDAVWTLCSSGYKRSCTVSANLFDNLIIDSLRIYTFQNPYSLQCKYLIGQNFLKRFNVYFDLKNKQMGLQPIKNFKRVVNPNQKRFHYSIDKTIKNKNIVDIVADYKKNYFKTAGLQVGDEIVAMNDSLYNELSYDGYYNMLETSDTIVLNIIRHGEKMKIVVPIDKNEEKGD